MLEVNKIHCGDWIELAKQLNDESIDMIVTSPPYWGLRDYNTEPVIFDGDEKCEHEWVVHKTPPKGGHTKLENMPNVGANLSEQTEGSSIRFGYDSNFCTKCGAWRGQLGLEPHPNLFIKHLVDGFRILRQKLRKSGSLYLNLGDTFFGSPAGNKDKDTNPVYTKRNNLREANIAKEQAWKALRSGRPDPKLPARLRAREQFQGGYSNWLQPKQKMLMPHRVAIALQDDGWILRNDIVWHKCLEENTLLFVKRKKRYSLAPIKDLFKNYDDAYMLTQNMRGEECWVKIKKVLKLGEKEGIRLVTKTGREVISTEEHRFVIKKTCLKKEQMFRKIKLKEAKEVSKNDYLYVNARMNLNLPKGTQIDYKNGFLVGFFLAEGSYIKNDLKPYKNNNLSKNAIKRWGEQSRGKKIVGVCLSCGLTDIEKGYIQMFKNLFNFKFYTYRNSLYIRSRDKKLLKFIQKYIEGEYCDGKHLTQKAFNSSHNFIRGVIDGFLSGDGYYEKESKRWRVGIKPNYLLKNQIEFLCRILHYDFRFHSVRKIDKFSVMSFSVRVGKNRHRTTSFGCISDRVEKIENTGLCQFYDLELEPLYKGRLGNNQYKRILGPTVEKRKSKYNNLYFLANGVWTHNSNPMPSSVKDRLNTTFEFVFHFVKSRKYFFDLDAIRSKYNILNRWGGNFMKVPVKPKEDLDNQQYAVKIRERLLRPNKQGRNPGDFWQINTQSFSGAHFATFPEKLCASPIKSSSPRWICKKCGKPRKKIIETQMINLEERQKRKLADHLKIGSSSIFTFSNKKVEKYYKGWSDCGCNEGFEPGIVLDPFCGSGTALLVAKKLGRNFIGFELSPDYIRIAENRLKGVVKQTGLEEYGLFKYH